MHLPTTPPQDFGFAALREAQNYRRALAREFAPHIRGRVVDVGAGTGQLTALLSTLPGVTELVAVEPDATFCAELRRSLPNLAVLQGTVAALPEAQPWNAFVCVNVLEHIRDDERELADYARRLRGAQGHLCLFVPARPEIYAPIDADFGHCRRYTRDELRRKLQAAGFEIVRLHYFNSFGYFAWWLNFRMLRRRQFNPATVRLFDRVIFPCVHWAESRLCRPPIGQSLLGVAQAR